MSGKHVSDIFQEASELKLTMQLKSVSAAKVKTIEA